MGFSENLIALGFFGLIFNWKLDVKYYFGESGVNAGRVLDRTFWDALPIFLEQRWADILFALFIMVWFFLYRLAVKSEMQILVSLYSRINPPHDWEKTIGARMIPLLSIGLTIAFFGLALTMDYLPLFCLIMLVLNMQDAMGNNILRKNLVRHFLKPEFNPHESDLLGPFIKERRTIALEYWVWKPQIERVSLMMFGTLAAFLAATAQPVFGIKVWPYTANFMIIAVILANEAIMSRWRIERDLALEDIEARQDKFERSMNRESAEADGTNTT
ncbi:hypothetical protein [Fodinicurvata sediminis]|uniref:hypothetical protein n=1 Tax=Fodinicurvata sediminis TaxID=1121832 RepID=UPI0003B41BA9|nr:hypothetical protein [Fodinicurvata sediminis]